MELVLHRFFVNNPAGHLVSVISPSPNWKLAGPELFFEDSYEEYKKAAARVKAMQQQLVRASLPEVNCWHGGDDDFNDFLWKKYSPLSWIFLMPYVSTNL